MADRTPTEWTDQELDAALRDLRANVPVDPAAAPVARTRLISAASALPVGTHRPAPVRGLAHVARRRTREALAVAAVAALIGVGLLVPTLWTRDHRPAVSAAAAGTLTDAAGAIAATDEPVGPGQYRYLDTHAWSASFSGPDIYLVENRVTVWVPSDPADPSQPWMLDRTPTGNVQWISGDQDAFEAAGGLSPDVYPTLQTTAACGDFYDGGGGCDRTGSWQDPTPAFLAGLPRDPAQLYDRLQADAPDNSRGDAELLVYAADLLRTGLVPADLRAALYQALATLPGLEITDSAVNLDGRVGTALGMDDGTERQDIIIDPATGAFIGEREVLTESMEGVPAGTTISFTSVTTDLVDALGVRPPQ